ncbi:hypothetical protein LSUCC0031_05090 [Rhodobacterales bacterium LSUCC0031]|nr:hypothetical protein [Rhodobacterales bacterium LSUCC0031]
MAVTLPDMVKDRRRGGCIKRVFIIMQRQLCLLAAHLPRWAAFGHGGPQVTVVVVTCLDHSKSM